MNTSSEFVLDFSIPQGPTGPTGPNPPICYIDYKTSTNNKNLAISSSQTFHSSGEFSVNGDAVTVESGTYEITFCGFIEATSSFDNSIMVTLYENSQNGTSRPITGMMMTLPVGTLNMHFSKTRIISFNGTKSITALITNPTSVSVRITMASLLLKKITV